ncbi:MAG: ribosome recycling factor [Lachnospiraceae bacterium]|nr:ribosome recycling factor [Lachnospiraceae bacterium]
MDERLVKYNDKMGKTIDNLEQEFDAIRAGRANPHILDRIRVNYYGTETPLQQVGNISVPDPKSILISPWDPKLIKDIEKAIQASDIGINPSNDGHNIRLVFPDLTEERRKDLAKEVKKKGEEAKVAIRNIRRDAIDAIKKITKAGEVSEDSGKDLEDEIQKLTDNFISEIDKRTADKTAEIMKV